MKYIKFTYVDAVTGISIAAEPALNGTKFPAVPGLEFVWARESQYPAPVPEFFGTCPDDSPTQVDGVLGVFLQTDWEQMRADEMRARVPQQVTMRQLHAADLAASSGSSLVGYMPAGVGAVAADVQSKLRERITPADKGAVGTGLVDDSAALAALFADAVDGTELHLTREYLITTPLIIAAHNVTLSGAGGYSKSMIRCVTPGVQMLTVTGYGFRTKNIALRGDGGANGVGATVKGIKFLRADGSSDVDATLQDTTIFGMAQSIDMNGNNLSILGGLIAAGLGGVLFTRLGTDESRGLIIKGVRFHSMGTIGLPSKCVVLNADAFNCEISDNFGDSIYSFYEGPINGITVDNNLLYRVSGPGINTLTATYTAQQRCGSVNGNTLFCNSPSYVGSGITLRMQNAQAIGNKIIGPRGHGIEMIGTTGSIISQNTIVSPNFVAGDGAIYDGIYADAGSSVNLITDNHIRSAGTVARSAMNIVSVNNTVMGNFVDTSYTTPYFAQKPLTIPTATGFFGIKKVPSRALDILGFQARIQQPDAINGTPAEWQTSFTNGSGAEIQGSTIKTVVASSGAGVEKTNIELWQMRNGAMTKHSTLGWQGDFAMVPLSTQPSAPTSGTMAMSDGTAGTVGWGASGAGLYRYSGSAWVFVG